MIDYSDAIITTPKSFSNYAIKNLISYNTCYNTIIMKIIS